MLSKDLGLLKTFLFCILTDKQGMPTGGTSGQRQLQNVPKNSPVLHQSSYHPLQAATSTSGNQQTIVLILV